MKIAITTSSFGTFDTTARDMLDEQNITVIMNPYGRKLDKEEIEDIVGDADGMVAGTEPLTGDVLKKLHNLRVISRCGVGIDNVDLATAESRGIQVFRTTGGVSAAVGELTVGLMLNLLRKVSLMDRALRNGIWKKQMGNLLEKKKVGIVGFGSIGQRVAALLKGFDVDIAYYDIVPQDSKTPFMELEKLMAWADILTLHCSVGPGDKALIGERELQLMKKGSWLVNAARGGVVNESALYDTLTSGYLAGAAVDVFENEPYKGKLAKLENVIVTPHIGSYAVEDRIRMERMAVENLLRGFKV